MDLSTWGKGGVRYRIQRVHSSEWKGLGFRAEGGMKVGSHVGVMFPRFEG